MTFRLVSGEGERGGEEVIHAAGGDAQGNARNEAPVRAPRPEEPPARPLVIYVNSPSTYAPTSNDSTHERIVLSLAPREAHDASDRRDDVVEGSLPVPRARGPWGEPVPEPWEFLPSPRRDKGVFEKWPRYAHALIPALVGVAFLCVSLLQWIGFGWNGAASGAAVFGRGEVWRLFTALLAHGDLGHLASNLLPFLFYGWMLQSYFGLWVFPLLALVAGLVSNAVTIALYPPQLQLLGASGMIYGMVALWLVLYLRFDSQRRMPQRVARAVGFALLMLMPTTYEPQVSYLAHASGFAAGLAGGFIVAPFVSLRDPT